MQFQNCTKTGLTQNFVYSKRHCLRFVLESILRKQRPNVWVKSQLRACVENAGARRSRICDSIPLLAVSHEMTWDPTLDSGSHLIPCEPLLRMQSLSFVSGFLMPTTSHSHSQLPSTHSQWCFLKTSYLWLSLLCISMEQPGCNEGRLGGGGRVVQGSHQSLSDAWHFPIDLFFKHPLPSSAAETFAVQPIQEPKYFPPNCRCYRCRAHEGVHACARHVPMKRQNLSKTLKVAKKSISSHKLFIIIVTSTIHYATENNCKEISQDRNLVRMHMHRLSGRLPKQTICQIVFFSFCKLKWDPPCRFLVFQVEPKIYYFTDPDTMT